MTAFLLLPSKSASKHLSPDMTFQMSSLSSFFLNQKTYLFFFVLLTFFFLSDLIKVRTIWRIFFSLHVICTFWRQRRFFLGIDASTSAKWLLLFFTNYCFYAGCPLCSLVVAVFHNKTPLLQLGPRANCFSPSDPDNIVAVTFPLGFFFVISVWPDGWGGGKKVWLG